jgi:VIT1/CCC1 family predicted Fe2+/Mn2+ transporter
MASMTEKKTKQIVKNKKTIKPLKRKISDQQLGIIFFAFPLIAWIIASTFNASGWASYDFGTFLFILPQIFVLTYWPICAIVLTLFVLFVVSSETYKISVKKAARNTMIVLLVIYTIFVYHETSTATESEFTG